MVYMWNTVSVIAADYMSLSDSTNCFISRPKLGRPWKFYVDMWKFYMDTAFVVAAECMSLSQHQLFISRPKLVHPWIRGESNFKDVQLGLVISGLASQG